MYAKAIFLASFVMASALFGSVCLDWENQIVNGEFDAGLEPWQKSTGDGYAIEVVQGAGLSGTHALKMDVSDAVAQDSIMVSQGGIELVRGAKYCLGFTAKADTDRQILVLLEDDEDCFWHEFVDLSPTAQTFSFEFRHDRRSSENSALSFVLQHPSFSLANEDENIDVYVDNVYLAKEPVADPNLAHYPLPPNGTIHPDGWAALTWSPGRCAVSHDVYIGKDFDDVNDGTGNTFWSHTIYTWEIVGFHSGGVSLELSPGTTYHWRIDEVNDLHPDSPWKGDVWSFTVIPHEAYAPEPAHGAKLVNPQVTLSWARGFWPKSYAVYFGDDYDDVSNSAEGLTQETTSYSPGPLEFDKTYYWRVDVFDGYATHTGDIWSFTTVPSTPVTDPNLAHSPSPPDRVMHKDTSISVSWSGGRHTISHKVYFGETFDDVNEGTDETYWGDRTATSFVFGLPDSSGRSHALAPGTTYYWRIDEVNDLHPDSPWKGDVWSFWLPPKTAYDPAPADDANCVDLNAALRWIAGYDAKLHTLYFGENPADVEAGTGGTNKGGLTATNYLPGPLELGKTYYWRVDEYDGYATHKGAIWSFSTPPLTASNPNPPDGAIHDDLWVSLTWSPGPYAASHDVYMGDNFDDVNDGVGNTFCGNTDMAWMIVGFLDYANRSASLMIPGATIYWRVDEVNDLHPDSPWKGDVWSFTIAPGEAYGPEPADGATLIDPEVTLEWTTCHYSKSHTVYFGDNFDDVNDATEGLMQEATSYSPGPLEFDKTYYWRVDVSYDWTAPYKGGVWSFTVMPECWFANINPRQCYGDADGRSQGKKKYWVSTNDLDVLVAAWNKTLAQIEGETANDVPLICADFDHLPDGKKDYRVSTNDLDILVANWQIADGPDADCP